MNYVLSGVETLLRNNERLTRFIKPANINVWSDIDLVPSGSSWPYVIITDADSPTRDLPGGQREEYLNVAIYICERSFKKQGAAQSMASDSDGSIFWIVRTIKDLLHLDITRQFALEGSYLGPNPIQCLGVSDEPKSQPFTPKGVTTQTVEWSTTRKRIDARYYRYSILEVAIA